MPPEQVTGQIPQPESIPQPDSMSQPQPQPQQISTLEPAQQIPATDQASQPLPISEPIPPQIPMQEQATSSVQGISMSQVNDFLSDPKIVKYLTILSYIGILFWVPIFLCKDSPSVKFHIKQGFIIFALEVVVGMVSYLTYNMWFLNLIISLLVIICIILSIIGIVNVLRNKENLLPVIGKFASKINFPQMKI